VLASVLTFAASLLLLLLAARRFTRAAEAIGLALGMTPFAVGVLIVSVGTSLPELVTAVIAVLDGASEIVAGNVLGANISNLLLVLAAAAMASPRGIRLGEQYLLIDLNFLVGSAFLLVLAVWDGEVGRGEGAFLLLTYALYVAYLLKEGESLETGRAPGGGTKRIGPRLADVALAGAAAAALWVGARFTVASLEQIATGLGVPPSLLAVTILSLGTTLPELVVSAVAARQGKVEIAVGNILGSCVFNSLAVAGVAAVIGGIAVPPAVLVGPESVLVLEEGPLGWGNW
jgi:cation:H+ antiporter